jgi:hypothetical protein
MFQYSCASGRHPEEEAPRRGGTQKRRHPEEEAHRREEAPRREEAHRRGGTQKRIIESGRRAFIAPAAGAKSWMARHRR